MKKILKLGAVVLAIVLVLSMSVTAFATTATNLTNGVVGTGSSSAAIISGEAVIIEKEITAFNASSATVAAPTITYSYSIAAGSQNKDVIDANSVAVKTKQGIVDNVSITGTAANQISWTTADDLSASSAGTKNVKLLTIDFSSVVFTGAGVYRYVITESLVSGFTYPNTGVTEGSNHTRYLDVYVKDGSGSGAAAYDVYGFALFAADTDINGVEGNGNTVAAAKKTTGFVADTTAELAADKYYTYDLTVSKTLTGDTAMNSHPFPFTVNFTNGDITQNVLLKTSTTGTVVDYTRAASAIGSQDGVVTLTGGGTGSSITYIGIPVGTDVSVYETNDVTGTTYLATTTTDGTADSGKSITWGTTPTAAAAYSVQNYNSLEAAVNTTKDTAEANAHTIAVANSLQLISPTGYVARIAPYALMLGVGLFLVLFSRRRRNQAEA